MLNMELENYKYREPWFDIAEWPEEHGKAIETELAKEISVGHPLNGVEFQVIAKRSDRDDVLLATNEGFFIVHVTWSRKKEELPFPTSEHFTTSEKLSEKLSENSKLF